MGLCTLLELAPKRPHDVAQIADKLLPSCCILLENLEKVYQMRAKEDEESEYDYEDDDGKKIKS